MLRFRERFLLNQVNSKTVWHGIACFRQWQLLLPSDIISRVGGAGPSRKRKVLW